MFKKKQCFWYGLLAILIAASLAWAGTAQIRKYGIRFEDEGAAKSTPPSGYGDMYYNGDELFLIDDAGTRFQIASQKSMDIPLADWSLSYSPITVSSYPHLKGRPAYNPNDSAGKEQIGIVWDNVDMHGAVIKVWTTTDDEQSRAECYVRIPEEYAGNGSIKLKVKQQMGTASQSTAPIKVDYKYFLHTDGSANDTTATQGTAVALAGTGYLEEISLSIPDTIAAGQLINLHVWRSTAVSSVDALKMVRAMLLFD